MTKLTKDKPEKSRLIIKNKHVPIIEENMKKWAAENPADADHIIRETQSRMDAEREAKILLQKMDSMGFYEFKEFLTKNPPSPDVVIQLLFQFGRDLKTQTARKSALKNKSQEEMRKAKDFVQEEWRKNKDVYEGNKSEFARVYSRLVKQKIGVSVTEKTIRERWLTNTP